MNQALRDKLESWLQRAPADPLTHVIEGNVPEADWTPALRQAMKILREARAAFEAEKQNFVQSTAQLGAACGAPTPNLPAARRAVASMGAAGHACLGHYVAVVEAGHAVGPLVVAVVAKKREQTEAEWKELKEQLAAELIRLGFAPTGTLTRLLGAPMDIITVARYVAGHPRVMELTCKLFSGYGAPPTYEVTAAAQKAAVEAATLLMDIELGQD